MLIRIFIIVLLTSQFGYSQNVKKDIQVLAKSKKEGIWLRWAPLNPTTWQLGNKYGYNVERFTLRSDGELESPVAEKLTLQPLKPYSVSELEKLATMVGEAEVLQELIYEEATTKSLHPNNPASVLDMNDELENKFGVALLVCDLSTEVAKAAGLFLSDNNVVKGKRYIYRVSLAQQPKGIKLEPGVVVTDMTDEKPLIEIKDLKADFRDHAVMLSWSTLMHQGSYSFYFIEKSRDGKVFNKVSDLPYVHMTESPESETAFFVDSLEVNMQTFYYRIIGVTPFGEKGQPSNIVQGEGRDDLSGFLVIREGKLVTDNVLVTETPKNSKHSSNQVKNEKPSPVSKINSIAITWEFPVEAENQINGFVVSRAKSADGPYEDVSVKSLSSEARSYTDQTSLNNNYYLIRAIDKFGNEISHSYPFLVQIEDNTPPAIPAGVIGVMDKNGVATLHWQPNSDLDIMGYRIFRSNTLKEEPVEITQKILSTTILIDTVNIKVLNREVYYHVVALDKNYNTSDYSKPLKLLRPDVIPPTSPVFTRSEVKKDTILLEWSSSVSNDVAKYELIRIEEGGNVKRKIFSWPQTSLRSRHSDASLIPGKDYQYKLVVYDSAGNSSEAITRKILFEPGYRKAVVELKAIVDRSNKMITIKWKNEQLAPKCLIYRKINEEKFALYKLIEGNVNSFEDRNISINNFYEYKVQLIFKTGVKSTLSEALHVTY